MILLYQSPPEPVPIGPVCEFILLFLFFGPLGVSSSLKNRKIPRAPMTGISQTIIENATF